MLHARLDATATDLAWAGYPNNGEWQPKYMYMGLKTLEVM